MNIQFNTAIISIILFIVVTEHVAQYFFRKAESFSIEMFIIIILYLIKWIATTVILIELLKSLL